MEELPEKEKFLQPKDETLLEVTYCAEKDQKISKSESIEMTAIDKQNNYLMPLSGNANYCVNQKNSSAVENEDTNGVQENPARRKYFGLILTFLSTFAFSIGQIVTKILAKEMHPFNMGIWTFLISAIFVLPFLMYRDRIKKKSSLDVLLPLKDHLKLVSMMVVRAVISPMAFILLFYAFENLEIGDAVVIISAAPIFICVLGWLFLGEEMGVVIILTSILAVAGVIVIVRPPILTGQETFDENLLVGIIFAVSCMLSMCVSFVIVRLLKGVYHGLMTLTSNTTGTLVAIILSLVSGVFEWPQSNYQILLVFSVAFLSFLGQTLLIVALRHEQVGLVSLIRTCGVIMAFLWQFFLFGKIPDVLSLVGGGMIMIGVVVIILRKWLLSLPQENKFRKRLAILLA